MLQLMMVHLPYRPSAPLVILLNATTADHGASSCSRAFCNAAVVDDDSFLVLVVIGWDPL